jgi:hypothetical protein
LFHPPRITRRPNLNDARTHNPLPRLF